MEDSHRHMSFGHPILPFSQQPLPPQQRSVSHRELLTITSASSLDLSPRHLLVLLLTMGGTRCSVPSEEQPLHFYARFHLLLPMQESSSLVKANTALKGIPPSRAPSLVRKRDRSKGSAESFGNTPSKQCRHSSLGHCFSALLAHFSIYLSHQHTV